jgi:tetratricopeptide (TPR) repeat protein
MATVHAAFFLFFIAPIVFAGVDEEWLALNERGRQLQREGNLVQAIELFQQAVRIADTISPPDARVVAAWNNLGLAEHDSGHAAEAERAYLRAIHIAEQNGAARSHEITAALGNLATLYIETGRAGKTETLCQRLEELFLAFDAGVAQKIRLQELRGAIHQARGRTKQAEECYRSALGLAETSPEFTFEAASALNNLSVLAYNRHDFEGAGELLERAVKLTESQAGLLSPRLVSPYVNEAALAFQRKDYKQAVQKLEQVITLLHKIGPSDSTFLYEVYDRYAIALRLAGRKADAKQAAEHARGLGLRDRLTVDVWSLRNTK